MKNRYLLNELNFIEEAARELAGYDDASLLKEMEDAELEWELEKQRNPAKTREIMKSAEQGFSLLMARLQKEMVAAGKIRQNRQTIQSQRRMQRIRLEIKLRLATNQPKIGLFPMYAPEEWRIMKETPDARPKVKDTRRQKQMAKETGDAGQTVEPLESYRPEKAGCVLRRMPGRWILWTRCHGRMCAEQRKQDLKSRWEPERKCSVELQS